MATTWQEYQEEVSEFFRSLGLEATTNHSVQGVRTSHDIDVYVRSHYVGFDGFGLSSASIGAHL